MAQTVCGLILAGGRGERFGGPKVFARLPDGRSFLESCVETLRTAGLEPIAATLPFGTPAEQSAGARAVPLPIDGLDMRGSARLGFEALLGAGSWRAAILLPVDHPLVRGSTVSLLAGREADLAVPMFGGKRGHPIRLSRALVEALVAGRLPGSTLREALQEIGRVDVPTDDPGVIANCNTPENLSAGLAATRAAALTNSREA